MLDQTSRTLLTNKQAADYLGCREQLLVSWRYENRGPAFHRLGGRMIRYAKSDLDAWLADTKVAPHR